MTEILQIKNREGRRLKGGREVADLNVFSNDLIKIIIFQAFHRL